jgi:hypothetical protein
MPSTEAKPFKAPCAPGSVSDREAQDGWPQVPEDVWGKPAVYVLQVIEGRPFRRNLDPEGALPAIIGAPITMQEREVGIIIGTDPGSGGIIYRKAYPTDLHIGDYVAIPLTIATEQSRLNDNDRIGASLQTVRKRGASFTKYRTDRSPETLEERRKMWADFLMRRAEIGKAAQVGYLRKSGIPVIENEPEKASPSIDSLDTQETNIPWDPPHPSKFPPTYIR